MLETGSAFGLTASTTNLKDLPFLPASIEQQIFPLIAFKKIGDVATGDI